MLNKISIMGRITKDLELKTTPNGIQVVSFRIATTRNYKGDDGEYPTDFFGVVAWRKTAEFICKYFGKGQAVLIDGTLQTRSYTDKNGGQQNVVEILVDNAHFCEKKSSENDNSSPTNMPQNNGYATTNAPQNSPFNGGYNQQCRSSFNDGEFHGAPADFTPNFGH